MILTDKTLQAFNKWNYENDFGYIDHEPTSLVVHFEDLDENLRNNIIINFFDSVGIYIEIIKEEFSFGINIHAGNYKKDLFSCAGYESRQEATEQAIINANKIYNETKV